MTARKQPNAKVGDPSKWKQKKQKQMRMEGKAYVSKRKKDGEAVTKQPRSMGPRCTSNACKKASNRFCNDIADDARVKMFDEFWHQMNWAQRKLYVAGLVDRDPVERPRPVVRSQSRRSVSLRYHLWAHGERKQVCKNMFLTTLGIGEWCVLNWAQKGTARRSESDEIKLEKRQTIPRCPERSPAPSTDTVDLTEGGKWKLAEFSQFLGAIFDVEHHLPFLYLLHGLDIINRLYILLKFSHQYVYMHNKTSIMLRLK